MGICAARFYFKEGLPKVQAIKEKFQELTGLYLFIYMPIDIVNLHDAYCKGVSYDDRGVGYKLYRDQETAEQILRDSRDHGKVFDAQKNLNSLSGITFSCLDFHRIGLDYLEEKSFYLEYSIPNNNSYFSEVLMKTMLELGGRFYKYSSSPPKLGHIVEDYLEPYYPHERRWKKLKKWKEYSDFERPKK